MRLNLGCGPSVFFGWLNVDVEDINETYLRHLRSAPNFEGWPEWQREMGQRIQAGEEPEIARADIVEHRKPPGVWVGARQFHECCDAIYLGQVVEHMNPIHQLPGLLKRCFEALKPDGVLRITTPDLALILEEYESGNMRAFASEQPAFYAEGSQEEMLSYLLFGATGPDCTRSNYEGHFHVWTKGSLLAQCNKAGFTGEHNFDWPSKRLTDVRDFGKSHSFALECIK